MHNNPIFNIYYTLFQTLFKVHYMYYPISLNLRYYLLNVYNILGPVLNILILEIKKM